MSDTLTRNAAIEETQRHELGYAEYLPYVSWTSAQGQIIIPGLDIAPYRKRIVPVEVEYNCDIAYADAVGQLSVQLFEMRMDVYTGNLVNIKGYFANLLAANQGSGICFSIRRPADGGIWRYQAFMTVTAGTATMIRPTLSVKEV